MVRSVMTHQFSQVPQVKIPRSVFNRSHGFKTTFDSGYLVPIYVDEALPGDTFTLNMSTFSRLATPIVPVMDNLFLDTFFFAVPIRLIWDNFQKFHGEQIDPGDSIYYLVPIMDKTKAPLSTTGWTVGSLADYFGIPTGVTALEHVSIFHRAYNFIWNEHFRDQNLQDSLVVDRDDGPDDPADYVIKRRGKRHDYFTSCLPWAQKGDAVLLPLGDSAPVLGIAAQASSAGAAVNNYYESDGTRTSYANASEITNAVAGGTFAIARQNISGTYYPNIRADLTAATAATINELRQAFQIQRLLERDARGGTRYTEIIRSHFGVVSPDARLQRPEYLGGGSSMISINPVVQTSSTNATSPQGNLAAYGTHASSGHGFSKSFTEHTIIMGLACVRADLNYQQGLNRMFSRRTRYDHYYTALAHLGEQAVLNKEIYCDGSANDELVFGYQERYAEYRYYPSVITGKFRSTYSAPLDIWHLAQEFSALPTLNGTFIEENPPVDRIMAVNTEPQILFDAFFDIKAARPMPLYSVPGLIDHF